MNGQRTELDDGRFQLVTFRGYAGRGVIVENKTGYQSRMLSPKEFPNNNIELFNLAYKLLYNKPE